MPTKLLCALLAFLLFALSACRTAQPTASDQAPPTRAAIATATATPVPEKVAFEIKKFERKSGQCKDEGGDCASLKLQFPEITAAPSPAVQEALNQAVRNVILANVGENARPFANADALAKDFLTQYKTFKKDFPDAPGGWTLNREVNIVYNDHNILSLEANEDQYMGGAHPNANSTYSNFNLTTGQSLKLSDLLVKGYEAKLNAVAEKEFRKARGLAAGAKLDAEGFNFDDNRFRVNQNFAVKKEGLAFFFNSYEVAPYAAGPTDFVVSYGSIKDLIKPDGLLAAALGK